MGFGGVGTMNRVMKSNKALLPKIERFKKTLGGYSNQQEKTEYDFPEATPQMLRAIRERLILENEQRRKKRHLALAFTLAIIVTISIAILA